MFGADTLALTLDLRDLLRLVVLSVALVVVAQWLFKANAPSRRKFVLWAAVLLLVCPWFVAWLDLAIPVGVVALPAWSLEQTLPWWLVWPPLTLSLLGLLRVCYAACLQRDAVVLLPKLDDKRLQRLVDDLVKPLGLSSRPSFRCYQPAVGLPQAPFASSKAGGQIVLPQDYADLDDNKLRAVVTHELVHLARRDDWGRLLVRGLVAFYWFLPWLRSMERGYLEAMEHSCDDRAADFFGPSLSYMEGVVGAAGLQVTATAEANRTLSVRSVNKASVATSLHPLLHRVLRFGHRREFDADTTRVAGYLLLVVTFGLALASVQPIAKPDPIIGQVMTAGLSVPVLHSVSSAPQIHTPLVSVTLAQPQSRSDITRSLRALDQPSPIYPGRALRAQLEGEVWVDYRIAMDGTVVNPVVVHSEPAGHFEHSALATVRRTRYQHLSRYSATPLSFARTGLAAGELRVRQRFRYQLQPSH